MRKALRVKFDQHPDLRAKLLETKGPIVEASKHDMVWGEGDGTGLNLMGLLLVEHRSVLMSEAAQKKGD